MTVTIYCPNPSARLLYVLHVIFTLLGRVRFQVKHPNSYSADHAPALSYGCILPDIRQIPDAGCLHQNTFLSEMPAHLDHPHYKGFFPAIGNYDIPFDLFASAFCILTDFWTVSGLLPLDEHGRAQDQLHPIRLLGWHTYPLIHSYQHELWNLLQLKPIASNNPNPLKLTLDIDEPWKHRHKPISVTFGGLAKAILQLDFFSLNERYKALVLKNDPFDVLRYIQNPEQLTLFFLIERHDARDGRHTWKNKAYRSLIQECRDRGFHIGIHPSYTSSAIPGRIAEEKNYLEDILKTPVYKSRQHFLRYRNPETFAELENAGIQEDYSVCPIHFTGYIRGMAIPFPWYNFDKQQMSSLQIVPVMVMDRALQKYQGIQANQAVEAIQSEIKTCKQAGGTCTLLWHNTTLSETGEWKGWKKVWNEVQTDAKNQLI